MGKVIKNTDNNVKNIYKINNRYISPYEKKSIKVFTFFLACCLFGNGVECRDMARSVFAFADVYLPDSDGGVA